MPRLPGLDLYQEPEDESEDDDNPEPEGFVPDPSKDLDDEEDFAV